MVFSFHLLNFAYMSTPRSAHVDNGHATSRVSLKRTPSTPFWMLIPFSFLGSPASRLLDYYFRWASGDVAEISLKFHQNRFLRGARDPHVNFSLLVRGIFSMFQWLVSLIVAV